MFIGRERDLAALNRLYTSGKFEFAVIYGRRRVGKTALISEFIKDKKSIYFMGVESNEKQNPSFSKSNHAADPGGTIDALEPVRLDCPHPPVPPNPVSSQQNRQLWYAGAAVSAVWACSCCPGSLGPPPAPLPRRAAGGPRPSASERWSAPFGARILARRASRRQRPA